jgi:hypothetical protein
MIKLDLVLELIGGIQIHPVLSNQETPNNWNETKRN